MQLWIVEHFRLHKKVPVLMNHNVRKKLYVMIHYYRYLFVKKKVFNYSELHFSEVTSHKIHTLAVRIYPHSGMLQGHENGKNSLWRQEDLYLGFPTN